MEQNLQGKTGIIVRPNSAVFFLLPWFFELFDTCRHFVANNVEPVIRLDGRPYLVYNKTNIRKGEIP
jgi:hypothetical protein